MMRNDMHEGHWSPFDPKWYQNAFDKFISTADELFNQDLIVGQGFYVPDADGSRSSVFRKDAVLSNSFNEKILRETLKDIYDNSSHKLMAANHDNTHFFKWHGHMSDMTFTANSNYCEFHIPTDTFISSKEKDLFKLSQFFRKWIKVEDILNNWNIFPWCCMVFIDQKISSEYEFHIDDREVVIRFPYYEYWVKANYRVYIYKFDTNAQSRTLITRELCENQWNWKMPVSYITDQRIGSAKKIMVTFNKTADPNIRKDGLTRVEFLGDNIEFLEIKDGYIDLSRISKFNNIYIKSEQTEWLWMSIVVPRFFHEYPILLPTDVIYRPYEPSLRAVVTKRQDQINHVKAKNAKDSQRQIYVDLNGKLKEVHNGWKQMIRPVVLSDAFDNPNAQPYKEIIDEIDGLRDLTVKGADALEDFRDFMNEYTTDKRFMEHLDSLETLMDEIHSYHNAFMDKRMMDYNHEYERRYKRFCDVIKAIKDEGSTSDYLYAAQGDNDNFYDIVSPCIYIPRELADKYYIFKIIYSLTQDEKIVWENVDEFMGQVRFQRPIDESDFWTFEYDIDARVWRPYPLEMTHHFPDVYIPKDSAVSGEPQNRLFKTFFFYTDMMNVNNLSREIDNPTPDWSDDSTKYYFEQGGTYRDIFMEKFYWMGIRAIYTGLLTTNTRWEALEHVIDNPSYDRFNELFMKTMDPYFKLGLATYLKSSNYNFPFDDAVEKMKEIVDTQFLGYKRVTNFEAYLNRSWIPSYFDYMTKIMDDWDYSHRLLRRPRNTFDVARLLPILTKTQEEVFKTVRDIHQDIEWILNQLKKETYNLDCDSIKSLNDIASLMDDNMTHLLDFTQELDLEIFSIDDINHIIDCLRKHFKMTSQLNEMFEKVLENAKENLRYPQKQTIQNEITYVLNVIPDHINAICSLSSTFNIDAFMLATNDLRSYLEYDKHNPDDNSLMGQINRFNDAWSKKVKEQRNKFFSSTTVLYGCFDPDKSYSREDIDRFVNQVKTVEQDLGDLSYVIREYWISFGHKEDQTILDKFDYAKTYLDTLRDNLYRYLDLRDKFMARVEMIYGYLDDLMKISNSDTEKTFFNGIHENMERVIASLSYIVGQNQKIPAVEALQDAKNIHTEWVQFVTIEATTFDKILKMAEIPSGYIAALLLNQDTLQASIDYMDTVNIQYHPDTSWPTYSDVFSVDSIELVSGGFLHEVGDEVFIPKLGSYKITELNGDIGVAKSIESLNYRDTSFRNPMWQSIPYDSITNGGGMGISVKPLSVTQQRILNDEVIISIVTRIQNAMYLIRRCTEYVNPFNNTELEKILDSIDVIKGDWDNIVTIYSNYMTGDMCKYVTEMVSILTSLHGPCDRFSNRRDNVDLSGFLDLYQKFIFDVYACTEKLELQDSSFKYYDEKIRTNYNSIADFYDNGSSWNDAKELKSLLNSAKTPINFFNTKIVSTIPAGDDLDSINDTFRSLLKSLDDVVNAVNDLPVLVLDITPILSNLEKKIKGVPGTLQKDIWYKIKFTNVAVEGSDYKVGDIVELVPVLPVDENGHPITALEDIVMNDVILYQVTQVEYGHVVKVQPLIDYALPYQIWGLRDTNSRVGSGFNLKLDVYSYEVQLSDTTLFNTTESDVSKLPPFDENDMFMFWFDNIHDLDIGYEVFIGGKQITSFVQRHESDKDQLHPKSMDVLYLNANEVMSLQNASIYIPAEHYFVYQLDEVEIKDPGAGYCAGQDIFVDTDQVALRLKVASLVYGPTKGIESIDFGDINLSYKVDNPSSDNAVVVPDSMNNIDDEFNNGYYDSLTSDGIIKPATKSHKDTFTFTSRRFDQLASGDRNAKYMRPDVDMKYPTGEASRGDPDYHWYLGSRSGSPHVWDGIMNIIPPTDSIIPEELRLPPGILPNVELQEFKRVRIHNSIGETNDDVTKQFSDSIINAAMIEGDKVVPDFASLPRYDFNFPEGRPGKCVIVEHDETHDGHRMLYRIRTYVAAGNFVYDLPEVADYKWDSVTVDWMNIDSHPDIPTDKAIYASPHWDTAKTHRDVQRLISDKKISEKVEFSQVNNTAYIDNITLDDISVFNWTTKQWEDLKDSNRWRLDVISDDANKQWGFTLTFLQDGIYSYDMSFFWNKSPSNQSRNALLKRNAILKIAASISHEVNKPASNISIYTGRHLRIRKLFPYEQKESFTIGKSESGDPLGYEMDFKLAPYIHFRNEIHLEDIKVYNKSAGRFEDILDPSMFEVRFKDPKAVSRGYETQSTIVQSFVGNPGEGFVDGEVWGWNETFGVHIFGHVTTNGTGVGGIKTFVPDHCPNPPTEDVTLEFQVYQHVNQTSVQMATVVIEFQTKRIEVFGDGYIHNVTNRFAPVPDEFKVIAQYNLDGPGEYDIIISKRHRKWSFMDSKWQMTPSFYLGGCNIQQNHLYVLTSAGRFPLVNPSTGKPSLSVVQGANGTEVKFLNLYRRYEKLEIHSVPYPMRSVYVQRRIPKSGYIDLSGKINKPLNKKYFEFWVNGKLLMDEVTIITPTKIFLHGLTSLKNFEIIEVNRDPNEYFSDAFLETDHSSLDRPIKAWNFRTYLDDALEGKLKGDNYTSEEQEYLLTPVWKQVEKDHPEYKNYPPNVDIDGDILTRTNSGDNPLADISEPNFQFMIIDAPSIEGYPLVDRGITFKHFGFIPIDDNMIIDLLNEEWQKEIENDPFFPEHSIMTDDEWYGMTARLYDEFGILVHTLNEAVYRIADTNLLRINVENKLSRIVRNPVTYDLS